MKRRALICTTAVTMIALAGITYAGIVGLTGKIGTLGYGGDLTVNLGSYFNARVGINSFSYEDDAELDDADVSGEITLSTIPILLDWHCFGGGFRVSGGLVMNNNKIELTASPSDEVTFNGVDYTLDDLEGEITFDKQSYYAGIGYGNAVGDGRWHFACDFGVVLHGQPDAEITASPLNASMQAQLDVDIDAEIENFEDDAAAFSVYPVISIGVSLAL